MCLRGALLISHSICLCGTEKGCQGRSPFPKGTFEPGFSSRSLCQSQTQPFKTLQISKRTERIVSNSKLPSMKKVFLSISWASFSFYHECILMASSSCNCGADAEVVKHPGQPDVNKEINILPLT